MTPSPRGRIAIVVQEFPKLSQTFVTQRFVGLLERGWDIHIVCEASAAHEWSRHPHLSRAELARRVHIAWPHRGPAAVLAPLGVLLLVLTRPSRTLAYLRRAWPIFGLRSLVRLYRDAALVRLGPDVVHFEFGTQARVRPHTGRLIGARTLVSFAGADVNLTGADDPAFYDAVWRSIDAAHAPSEDNRRRAISRGCPADVPFAVIPPVMDLARFAPSAREPAAASADAPLRVISVGRLHEKKGFDVAMRAVGLVLDAGVPCVLRIVGEGADRDALLALRDRLRLAGSVELTGAVAWREVPEQMRWADVYLHAAVSEGFGIVVTEAQATGLPVVTTDAEGLAENVEDGVTGYVVPRGDPEALADRVRTLATDPSLRKRMGRAGRARALTVFDRDAVLDRYADLYRSVLDHQGAGATEAVAR